MYGEPSSRDEQQMTESILTGDAKRYHDLIWPCGHGIYRVVLSFLKNPADAEDVAQESFLITTGTIKVRLHGARIIMRKQVASQLKDAIPGKGGCNGDRTGAHHVHADLSVLQLEDSRQFFSLRH